MISMLLYDDMSKININSRLNHLTSRFSFIKSSLHHQHFIDVTQSLLLLFTHDCQSEGVNIAKQNYNSYEHPLQVLHIFEVIRI